MFQEEFAKRLSARPGEDLYCRLSVNTQLLAKVDQLLKVGRNNFRPPPKVDSRVVRIELRNPPPPVDFLEWDGLVRLLFNRKNKTLRSVLCTKSTIKLLGDNFRTFCAMKEGDDTEAAGSSGLDVKAILEEVLSSEHYKDKRAAKLDIDDILSLLAVFNERGLHFA
jgi:18S rRNA (adenine1779-N6/adenine1780-N6)-dimethyltransferase